MIRVLLVILMCISQPLWADASAKMVQASDLSGDAIKMSAQSIPMVVEMAAEYCSYCKLIEEQVLVPMILSGEYEDKIVLRRLDIGEHSNMTDFSGKKVTQVDFAERYNIRVTPTVLFLNQKGEEIAPRMVGVPLIDFYGTYLDNAIEAATQQMQKSL